MPKPSGLWKRVRTWDDERDEDKMEGDVLEMNGKRHTIKSKSFIFLSSHLHKVTIQNKIEFIYLIPCILNVVLFL